MILLKVNFPKKFICFILTISILLTISGFSVSSEETEVVQLPKTSIGLAEFGLSAYEDNWQYSYGGIGYANSNGVRSSDCSGLIFSYLCWNDEGYVEADYSMPRTVSQQVNASIAGGDISTLPRIHGLILVSANNSHVGIYLGGDLSADNSDYGTNMQLRTVSEYSGWSYWYMLKDVSYPTTGWYVFNDIPYYYLDGQYVVSTNLDIGNTTYTFDENGVPSPIPTDFYDCSNVTSDKTVVLTENPNYVREILLD